MKQFIFAILSVLLLSGCRKNNGNGPGPEPPPPDFTPIPAASPVSTGLGIYAPDNSQTDNPLFTHIQGTELPYNNVVGGFHKTIVNADQFTTRVTAQITKTTNYPGYDVYRMITTLPALKNYADIAPSYTDHIATLFNTESGTYPIQGGGQIVLPVDAFTAGTSVFSVSGYFLHPQTAGYALHLPSYPMADASQKRYFLDSYGVHFFQTYCADQQRYTVNFRPGADITVKMPIHPTQLANAPDTMPTWNLDASGRWKREGYALKVNGNYERKIDRKGFWNFANPVNGVYVKLRLVNSLNATVANTRFIIRQGQAEIADGRSNSNGEALVFVPVGKSFTLEVINDHFSNWWNSAAVSIPIGPFNHAMEKTVNIPPRIELITLQGSVFGCDGTTPLNSGTVTLTYPSSKDEYVFPIVNGEIKTSNWINYAYNIADLVVRDNGGTVLSNTKVVLGSATTADHKPLVKDYHLALYSCANAGRAFSYYRIDNGPVTRVNENAATTALTGNDSEINLVSGGSGINIKGWFSTVGGNYFLNDLKVNGVNCTFDEAKGWSEIVITRRDANPGGYIEGWYSINYKDPSNVSKNINGNFRVKKTL